MPSIDWQIAEAIATVVSSITIGASAIAVVLQLRQSARGQFFSVTAHLFEIWQSPEFQRDQFARLGDRDRSPASFFRVLQQSGLYSKLRFIA